MNLTQKLISTTAGLSLLFLINCADISLPTQVRKELDDCARSATLMGNMPIEMGGAYQCMGHSSDLLSDKEGKTIGRYTIQDQGEINDRGKIKNGVRVYYIQVTENGKTSSYVTNINLAKKTVGKIRKIK